MPLLHALRENTPGRPNVGAGIKFPYPAAAYGLEITFLFLYVVVELTRVYLVGMGNKTEQVSPIVWGTLLAVPVAAFNIYNLAAQTYV